MDKAINKGRILVYGICIFTGVSVILRNISDFNLFNVVIHLIIIFGLIVGIPKIRWIAAGLYTFIAVSSLWLLMEIYRIYAFILPTLIVNIVIAVVIIGLLVFNKDVDAYLYYKEVG